MAQPQRLFTPQESHRLQIKQLESKQPFTESDCSRPAFSKKCPVKNKKKRFIQSFVKFSAMQAENQCASQEAACEHIMLERVYCFYALSLLSV